MLAPPTISLEHSVAKYLVVFDAKLQSGPLLAKLLHCPFLTVAHCQELRAQGDQKPLLNLCSSEKVGADHFEAVTTRLVRA
jgi:hypothetical protein